MADTKEPGNEDDYERPKNWEEHEAQLLAYVEGSIKWHRQKSAWWHRMSTLVSLLLVILAAITPVLVTISVRSNQTSVSPTLIFWLSILCSLLVAVVEGLRRTFRVEDHWRQTHIVMETLLNQRKSYVANQFGLLPGASEWIRNYRNYDRAVEGLLNEFTNHLLRRSGDEMGKGHEDQPKQPAPPTTSAT